MNLRSSEQFAQISLPRKKRAHRRSSVQLAQAAPNHGEVSGDLSRIMNLARRLRDGDVSAVSLTLEYLNRIEETEPLVSSFISVDVEVALERADVIDRELRAGVDRGLLSGIPIAVKDNICTKDFFTTAGSKILDNHKPSYNADVVENLQRAGAVIIGKTNMDEFGMGSTSESSQYATTCNPWDVSRVPGGSSGGSAAAVAARQCVAALGSDTGGSVRQPASHCGVVGFKPTYGALSRHGLISYASSFDCIGTLTSSVHDCILLVDTLRLGQHSSSMDASNVLCTNGRLTVNEKYDGIKPLQGKRFAVIKEAVDSEVSDDVRESFADSLQVLRNLGAHVETVSCKNFLNGLPAYYILAMSEASSNLARYDGIKTGTGRETIFDSRQHHLGDEIKRRILMGTYTLSDGYADAYYERANKVRQCVAAELHVMLQTYDVLLTPVATTVAPKLNTSLKSPLEMYVSDALTVNVNLTGLPALVLKAKEVRYGQKLLPVGVQLIGRSGEDAQLLDIGMVIERAFYECLNIKQFADVHTIDDA
jgi:aspartyl-tRNA(Asn)/glutamyl-tRNA(Gln) amidotransferase subunit A